MKQVIYIVASIVFLVVLISCNEEDNFSYVSSEEADILAFDYIELVENQYVLNLTNEKANQIGISSVDYQRIQSDIKETNEMLRDLDISTGLPNPQNMGLDFNRPFVKTRSETTPPDGRGIIPNEEYITIQISVPENCYSITMNMYSISVYGFCTATLYYVGQAYSTGSCVSSAVTGAGSFTLNVPVGGATYSVTLRVSSSFGGSYYYNFNCR